MKSCQEFFIKSTPKLQFTNEDIRTVRVLANNDSLLITVQTLYLVLPLFSIRAEDMISLLPVLS